MIKRWIARRRRRLNLYGRMSSVESRLGALALDSTSTAEGLAGRLRRIEEDVAGATARLSQTENDLSIFKGDVLQAAASQRQDRDTLHDGVAAAKGRADEAFAAAAEARDVLHALSIRLARLETQRQLDVEEGRQTASASLQALKRTVLKWRTQADTLEQIDKALPTPFYAGRPSENRRPSRLRLNLAAGTPVLEAQLGEKLHLALLAPDGAPTPAALQLDHADDDWAVFAPIGSLLAPHFRQAILDAIKRHPDAALFYADDVAAETEDAIDQIRFKPEFDPTLLSAQDYIGSPIIVRLGALSALGGLDAARGTAACADLVFRANAEGMMIRRIPEVLLVHPKQRVRATVSDYRAMLQAQPSLGDYDILPGQTLDSFRLARRFVATKQAPVSILIPTRRATPQASSEAYVERLLISLAATDWPMDRLTVIVGDDIPETPEWALRKWPFTLRRIATPRAPLERFNYAAKMNLLWRAADTEQIVFMNDDVRALDGGWLKALQTFAMDPAVGGVGARLLFEDGSLQHAGMAPHGEGTAHLWIQRLGSRGLYQDWALVHREWSMVTGAIFATRRTLMETMAGFDERFSLEFNDTDLCLRLRRAGHRIVCTPFAQMVHVERASRRQTPPPREEADLFDQLWSEWLANDPSWHPGLDRARVEVMPQPAADAWYL